MAQLTAELQLLLKLKLGYSRLVVYTGKRLDSNDDSIDGGWANRWETNIVVVQNDELSRNSE